MAFQLISFVAFAIASVVATDINADGASPKAANLTAEQKYKNAVDNAKSVEASCNDEVQDLRSTAHNSSKIQDIGDAFLKAQGGKPNWQVMRALRTEEFNQKVAMRTKSRHAHAAWRRVKHWARVVERDTRHAGVIPEHVYEKTFEEQERFSEKSADRMEDLGDKGEDSIEQIYGKIRKRFEAARKEARKEKEEAAKAAAAQAAEAPAAPAPASGQPPAPAPAPAPPPVVSSFLVQKAAPAAEVRLNEASKSPALEPVVLLAACVCLVAFVAAVRSWTRRPTEEITTYHMLA